MKAARFTFLAAVLLCGPLLAAPAPKGHLFIIGGGDWPDGMLARYVALATSFGSGRIVIFPMASGSPAETAAEEATEFKKAGAKDIVVSILTREQALEPASAAVLDGAGGVFFSGGDQALLTAVLLDTPVHEKMRDLYERGGVIGGTSAGAAVMSEVMITGDEVRKVEAGREFETIQAKNVITKRGFGFIRNAIVDQHFVTRKRYNRMLSLLAENPGLFGIAIDESTAILVESGRTFEVLGLKQVIICDPSRAAYRIRPDDLIGFTGLAVHALIAGDRFNLETRVPELAETGQVTFFPPRSSNHVRKEKSSMVPDLTLALPGEIGDNDIRPGLEARASGWIPVVEDERSPFSLSPAGVAALAISSERARAGQERALETLYEANKTRIYRLAYRHTFNPVIAEDLLQDTFVKVFSHLDDVKDPATFPAWLYRIALNTCYSYLRGKKLRSETMVPLSTIEGRLEEAAEDSPENDLRGPIASALETLPPKLKRIFVLHDVEGFKHGEIARILGCSVGTSKSQLFKARMKVRRILRDLGIGKESES